MNQTRVRVPVYFPYTFSLVVVQLIVEILILMVVSAVLFTYVSKSASSAPTKIGMEEPNIAWPEQESEPSVSNVEKNVRKTKRDKELVSTVN